MGSPDDPLSAFEDLLERFLDEGPRPTDRYARQRAVELRYGWNTDESFTIRCPRCRNNVFFVDRCDRCNHVGIVGVVTVAPDRSYL